MSVKHLVFLVHGIGAHKTGWSDGFGTRLIEKATKRLKELYWGDLALVERSDVASAMVSFRIALDAKLGQDTLARLALALAHACRGELAESWGTDAWKR